MNLTAEQIQENWEEFIGYIDTYISEPRKTALKAFYEKYAERIMLMPAAHKKEYNNAFPGGYIDHVNRVIRAALRFEKLWDEFGVYKNYTIEELVFSAMNHDLGKMGDETHEAYIPQTDQWRKEKLGEDYKFNDRLEFMPVPDRSLYLLNSHGISYTKNEMLAIKLHDGLYDESNKTYLVSWSPETRPRTSLIYIIQQADLMSARIEFENEWAPKLYKNNLESTEKDNTLNKSVKKTNIKTKALNNIKSEGLKNVMQDFFND